MKIFQSSCIQFPQDGHDHQSPGLRPHSALALARGARGRPHVAMAACRISDDDDAPAPHPPAALPVVQPALPKRPSATQARAGGGPRPGRRAEG